MSMALPAEPSSRSGLEGLFVGAGEISQAYPQLPQRLGPGDCPWRLGAAGGRPVAWGWGRCRPGTVSQPDLINFTSSFQRQVEDTH